MRNTELHYGRKKYTKSVGTRENGQDRELYMVSNVTQQQCAKCTVLLYNMQALTVYVTLFSILDKLVMYIL